MSNGDSNEDRGGPFLFQLIGVGGLIVILFFSIATSVNDFIEIGLAINSGHHPVRIPPDIVCTLFIVFNILRVWLGLTFLHSDVTFRREVDLLKKRNDPFIQRKELHNRAMTRLSWVVFGLFALAVKEQVLWGLVVVFILQSIILVYLDVIWWNILISKDQDRAANKFIMIGDLIVLVFSIGFAFFWLATQSGRPVDPHWESGFFLVTLGALIAVFGGECWSQYFSAFGTRWNEVFRN